jgi:hypothetical protein
VQLGPKIRTLAASRGAVLAELGRFQEGKVLLEAFVSDDDMPPFGAFMSRVFLARAEHALGDAAGADRLMSEARAILATTDGKPKLVTLIGRIENEMQIEGR